VPSWYYEIVAPGFKYNLTDIAGGARHSAAEAGRAFQQRRMRDRGRVRRGLSRLPLRLPPQRPGDLHAWHLYVVRLTTTHRSSAMRSSTRCSAGIGCSVHYIPLHLQPYWRDRYGLRLGAVFRTRQHAVRSGWSACRWSSRH
jgi:dTDP-4-amino-4,6-dideoxygalactose transaminase